MNGEAPDLNPQELQDSGVKEEELGLRQEEAPRPVGGNEDQELKEKIARSALKTLDDLVEDPNQFRHFAQLPNVKEALGQLPEEERNEVFHRFRDKYREFPGEEEEERQIRQYLGQGHGSRWQARTLQSYRERFPGRPIEEDKWKQVVRFVREELRFSRLEEYKDRARSVKDSENLSRLADLQVPIYRRGMAAIEALEGGAEVGDDVALETISDNEGKRILSQVEIQGDAYGGERLTKEILEKEGLFPKHKVRMGESTIWFSSSPYKLGGGRLATVAYVESGDKMLARSYYRSNSQGIWRYMPEYTVDEDGRIDWFGKGFEEQAVTLPVQVQKALSTISQDQASAINVENPELVFAGTAHQLSEEEDKWLSRYAGSTSEGYRLGVALYLRRIYPNDYRREVAVLPTRLEGNLYSAHDEKNAPGQVSLADPQENPDYSKQIAGWQEHSSLYGDISIEVLASKNDKLKFMFCRDSRGRVWIGGIENSSPIQSTGLRKSWIDGGDLTTPAFEYKTRKVDQTGGYGNDNLRVEPYVDMWENYLSKVPMIQEYLHARRQKSFADFPEVVK